MTSREHESRAGAGTNRRWHAWRSRRKLLWLVAICLFIGAPAAAYRERMAVYDDVRMVEGFVSHYEAPKIAWVTAAPQDEGLSGQCVSDLFASLKRRRSATLILIRGGRIVSEWYNDVDGSDFRQANAAMAKGVVGSIALLTALTEGRLRLDDSAWHYIPAWRTDSIRSAITIRDLASHRSGLADVDFFRGEDGDLAGWRAAYYAHPDQRFSMAIHRVPMIFEPGSHWQYSGIGYYALAYAITASLQGGPEQDIPTLLEQRIMRPLGIPRSDWELSYGQTYHVDGMRLYAIGSGAAFAPRAEARIGELLLEGGRWNGRQLIDRRWIEDLLQPPTVTRFVPDTSGARPVPAGGWYLNADHTWPALAPDAFAAIGTTDKVLLVVPSLDLVMLRTGGSLASPGENLLTGLRDQLMDPLARCIVGPSQRMRDHTAPFVHLAVGPH